MSCSIGEFLDYWRTEGKRYRVNLLTRNETWGRELDGCCMNGTRLLVFIEWLPVAGRGPWSSGRQTRDESREEWSEAHWHTEGHWRIHVWKILHTPWHVGQQGEEQTASNPGKGAEVLLPHTTVSERLTTVGVLMYSLRWTFWLWPSALWQGITLPSRMM
jgi:hypothetical protein